MRPWLLCHRFRSRRFGQRFVALVVAPLGTYVELVDIVAYAAWSLQERPDDGTRADHTAPAADAEREVFRVEERRL